MTDQSRFWALLVALFLALVVLELAIGFHPEPYGAARTNGGQDDHG